MQPLIAPFGLDLSELIRRLDLMEERIMTTVDEALAATSAKLDVLTAALSAVAADVAILVSLPGTLTAEQQSVVDSVTAKLDAAISGLSTLDSTVGDLDGSGPVVPATATEPAPEA